MAPSRALFRAAFSIQARNTIPRTQRRCFASATEKGTGPLAGIRVLDMTRVLAGVCSPTPDADESDTHMTHSRTAHRCSEIWGKARQSA